MKNHLSDTELVKRALPLFAELAKRQLLEVCVRGESSFSGNPPAPFVTCRLVTRANPNGPCIDLWTEDTFPVQGEDESLLIEEPARVQ